VTAAQQPSLFDLLWPALPPKAPPPTGDDLRDQALQRVEAACDPDWDRAAEEAVRAVARRQPTLTTDDVWALLEASDARTHERRALGAVLRRLAEKGVIAPVDRFVKSQRPVCHGRKIQVWRSLVCPEFPY
jgi:hypothetical protein